MGIVLKAFDPELERVVALKLLAPALAANPESRERFLHEARAGAKLQHENVMPIYAVDQHGTYPYLVMPLVDGPNLQEHLDRNAPLPIDEIVRIAHQACRALEEAHANGLVHRDIKPANIMLIGDAAEEPRRVWLTDFGLAHAATAPIAGRDARLITGTPGFMAPEQIRGGAIDPRTDLFAFGSVLYAIASDGRSPFQSDSIAGTMERVQSHAPAPLTTITKGLPDWFDHLVFRLLEKDPDKRPNSATEVRQILERHLPERRKLSVRRTILISAAVATITAILTSLSIFRKENGVAN
jgi:serine/threonine protein kinase